MRKFQDVYYNHVGEPCGLLRFGPKRQRLSRKDYIAQKHAARLRSVSVLEERRVEQNKARRHLKSEAQRMLEQQSDLNRMEEQLQHQHLELVRREERVSQSAKVITICINKFHHILNKLAKVLKIPAFASIEEGLEELEEVAEAVHQEFSDRSDQMVDDGPTL
jgi:uncharacterized protein (DUF3084 family)